MIKMESILGLFASVVICVFLKLISTFIRTASDFCDHLPFLACAPEPGWAEVNDPVANDGANNRNIDYQGRHRHSHYSLSRCKPQDESAGIVHLWCLLVLFCSSHSWSFKGNAKEVPWVSSSFINKKPHFLAKEFRNWKYFPKLFVCIKLRSQCVPLHSHLPVCRAASSRQASPPYQVTLSELFQISTAEENRRWHRVWVISKLSDSVTSQLRAQDSVTNAAPLASWPRHWWLVFHQSLVFKWYEMRDYLTFYRQVRG